MAERNSIIRETRAELDTIAREVTRAEEQLMADGVKLSGASGANGGGGVPVPAPSVAGKRSTREGLDLAGLYSRQDRVGRKFSLFSRAYEISCKQDSAGAIYHQLGGYLFRSSDDLENIPGVKEVLRALAGALHAYFHVSFDVDHERKLAQAWMPIETTLRGLGREI